MEGRKGQKGSKKKKNLMEALGDRAGGMGLIQTKKMREPLIAEVIFKPNHGKMKGATQRGGGMINHLNNNKKEG